MSVDNGNIIANHKIVYNPDSIADIRTAIGSGSGDLGTLCQSKYINKWAKYKPITVANLLDTTGDVDTTTERIGSSSEYFRPWKATTTWYKTSNCGLQVRVSPASWEQSIPDSEKTEASRESEANSFIEWYQNNWIYAFRPNGTMASPFRILDFHCYDHNAVAFVKSVSNPEYGSYYAGDGGGRMIWSMQLPTASEARFSVNFSDIAPITNGQSLSYYHFGLMFINTGSKFPSSNFKYRKFVITCSDTIGSGGTSLTVDTNTQQGSGTAVLLDNSNTSSAQFYDVYPILSTGALTTVTPFGGQSFGLGTMIVVPNARPFSLEILPNELDGSIIGELNYASFVQQGDNRYYSGSYVRVANRKTTPVSFYLANMHLELEIWHTSSSQYVQDHEPYTNPIIVSENLPSLIELDPNESISIYIAWIVPESDFLSGPDYILRQTGYITYNSGSSTTVLLASPPYAPNDATSAMVFQSHISVRSTAASYFEVDIWAENISEVSQDFNWGMIVYDVTIYTKDASGTDFDNPSVSTNIRILDNTPDTVPSGGTTQTVKTIRIETPNGAGVTGYYANVFVHSNTGYNVGNSSTSANYPNT